MELRKEGKVIYNGRIGALISKSLQLESTEGLSIFDGNRDIGFDFTKLKPTPPKETPKKIRKQKGSEIDDEKASIIAKLEEKGIKVDKRSKTETLKKKYADLLG